MLPKRATSLHFVLHLIAMNALQTGLEVVTKITGSSVTLITRRNPVHDESSPSAAVVRIRHSPDWSETAHGEWMCALRTIIPRTTSTRNTFP
jgi:hypothetical protein